MGYRILSIRILEHWKFCPWEILFYPSLQLQYLNGLQNIRILALSDHIPSAAFLPCCKIWMGRIPSPTVSDQHLNAWNNIWHLTLKSWKGVYWESFIQTQYETALTFHQLDRTWPALVLSLITMIIVMIIKIMIIYTMIIPINHII